MIQASNLFYKKKVLSIFVVKKYSLVENYIFKIVFYFSIYRLEMFVALWVAIHEHGHIIRDKKR